MSSTPLFDAAKSAAERDAALANVEGGTPQEWKAVAFANVRFVAEQRSEFTTDDVQRRLLAIGVGDPPEPRAWGPVMRRAAAAGWVAKTDRTRKSAKVSCHRRDKRVWRSLLPTSTA